jgi:lactonase family protein with 7-bladed beta-propeller
MSRWLISASIAILSWPVRPVTAQSASLHLPISGFVYSQASRTIRPLLGVPGATQIGTPVLKQVDFASVGPSGAWALLTRAGRSSYVSGLADLTPKESSAGGLIDAVDQVVWNRDGSFALLYSSSGNQLQRIQFSSTGATPDPPIDLSPWGPVTALAIDPAGLQIAFGVPQSGLYWFTAGQSPALLSRIAQPAAIAFDGTGKHLYAVDLAQQQILQFDSAANASTFVSLAQSDTPAVTPVGLGVSGDGRYLFLADSAAQAVRVYGTNTATVAVTIPLDFPPTRFEVLSSGPTILLNGDNPQEWLLVLDARQLPGLFFVPARREEAQ